MRLGFCGLGLMGRHMAERLLDGGHEVKVWNPTVAKAEPLREHGALVASTPAEAARGAEGVITMLEDAGAAGLGEHDQSAAIPFIRGSGSTED